MIWNSLARLDMWPIKRGLCVDNYAEGRKEMFYLTTLSTHFIYGYMASDHSDSEKGNPLPPHRLIFSINSKGSFICTIPDRIAHTTAFVIPVVEHWLEREIAQWVHPMKDNYAETYEVLTHAALSDEVSYRLL